MLSWAATTTMDQVRLASAPAHPLAHRAPPHNGQPTPFLGRDVCRRTFRRWLPSSSSTATASGWSHATSNRRSRAPRRSLRLRKSSSTRRHERMRRARVRALGEAAPPPTPFARRASGHPVAPPAAPTPLFLCRVSRARACALRVGVGALAAEIIILDGLVTVYRNSSDTWLYVVRRRARLLERCRHRRCCGSLHRAASGRGSRPPSTRPRAYLTRPACLPPAPPPPHSSLSDVRVPACV